jgi:hypothetical protein
MAASVMLAVGDVDHIIAAVALFDLSLVTLSSPRVSDRIGRFATPLAAGVVDTFRAAGLRIFGPTQAAAQLESSKAFSKAFMQRHAIPTAAFATFNQPADAHAYVDARGAPIVVKADGLAAGKGVAVATTLAQAHVAVDYMLSGNPFGSAQAGQARVVPWQRQPEAISLQPPGSRGLDRLRLRFAINASGELQMTATDLLSGAALGERRLGPVR